MLVPILQFTGSEIPSNTRVCKASSKQTGIYCKRYFIQISPFTSAKHLSLGLFILGGSLCLLHKVGSSVERTPRGLEVLFISSEILCLPEAIVPWVGVLAAHIVPESYSPPSHSFPPWYQLIVLVQLLLRPLHEVEHRSN